MKILETFRGLYVDLSGLPFNRIESEREGLRNLYPFLLPDARFIYSHRTVWRPPTQAEYDRRERERAQLRTPIGNHRESKMRYQEEMSNRENPIRIGTKHIKVNGVEYPFVAVSDRWRPALLHDNRMVWVRHYRAIQGLRRGIFRVYYATVKVPYNRLPWTVNNQVIETGGRHNDGRFEYLLEAINTAVIIAQQKDLEIQRSNAASLLGRQGGLIRSENKTLAARENGKRGGRVSIGSKLKLT